MPQKKAFFQAISNRDQKKAEELLSLEPMLVEEINDSGHSGILWAMYHHEKDLAEKMAKLKPQLSSFEAAALGALQELQSILEKEPERLTKPAPDGFTLLHYACYFSHFATAKWLIAQGSNLRLATPEQRLTPLHSAVAARATPIVQLLLASGAEPNVRQKGGYTPLMSAASHGELEIIEALLRHGASTETLNDHGQSALEMAQAHNQDKAVALLQGA